MNHFLEKKTTHSWQTYLLMQPLKCTVYQRLKALTQIIYQHFANISIKLKQETTAL